MSQADSLRHIAILWDSLENEIDELRKENDKLQARVNGYVQCNDKLQARMNDYVQRLDTEMSEVTRLKYELSLRKGF